MSAVTAPPALPDSPHSPTSLNHSSRPRFHYLILLNVLDNPKQTLWYSQNTDERIMGESGANERTWLVVAWIDCVSGANRVGGECKTQESAGVVSLDLINGGWFCPAPRRDSLWDVVFEAVRRD